MIAVIDYGMGNLHSVQKALVSLGHDVVVTSNPSAVEKAYGVVLPGVGAFGDAMENLKQLGMIEAIAHVVQRDIPLLGICLGMQLLFTSSEEHGQHQGLNLLPGRVKPFQGSFKIPHMGWNELRIYRQHPLLNGIAAGEYAYFVHSYYVEPADPNVVLVTTDYYGDVPAIVGRGNVMGIQFHPEKSSRAGLRMLENFGAMCRKEATR